MFIKSRIYLDDEYVVMTRNYFLQYTQLFRDTLIQHMKYVKKSSDERALHKREYDTGVNERQLQIQECKVQEVKALDACSGEKDCSRIVLDNGNVQGLENQSNTFGDKSSRSRNECNDKSNYGDDTDISPSYDTKPMVEADSNVTIDSPDMYDNEIQTDHNAVKCDDERVALANLIANLKREIDENKTIQKQLKKANASLTQELTECKSILAETSKTLAESNSIRDSCLVALQNKQTEFERYKAFNDRTIDYDKLEQKHDELVKQSLLTKSHYEGLVKEKTK
ncbi:hypothetical protein Tco_1415400, partial [Tanacetum coccineum]